MELTNEKAYEAICNGAKNVNGDVVSDWINFNNKRLKIFNRYSREKDFEQYLYDIKIWYKCVHLFGKDGDYHYKVEKFFKYFFYYCYNWKR